MTREEFYSNLLSNVQERLSDCFHKEQLAMEKMKCEMGEEFMCLKFIGESDCFSPIINLDECYERYLTGEDVEDAAREIEETGRGFRQFMEEKDNLSLESYEDVRGRITLFPISKEMAQKDESDFVREDFEFFSVRFYARLTHENDYTVLFPVSKQMLECWGKTKEDLLQDAFRQQLMDGIILASLQEAVMTHYELKKNLLDKKHQEEEIPAETYLILTNSRQSGGAALILNEKILQRVYERLGCNYYIVPSSIHDVTILQDKALYDPRKLSNLARMIHEKLPARECFLGEEAMYYDKDTGKLISAAEHVNGVLRKVKQKKDQTLMKTHGKTQEAGVAAI